MSQMPTWEGFLRYCLLALQDGQVRGRQEINALAAAEARLGSEQIAEMLSSGEPMYANRIGWALSFLANVGALNRPKRGHYVITDAGRRVLARTSGPLSERGFRVLAEDHESGIRPYTASVRSGLATPAVADEPSGLDPIEQIEQGIGRVENAVAADLLDRLRKGAPEFFERAVVRLLVAMGYGGAEGRAQVTRTSGDEGIDGIIDSDALGINRVYVQAKRYAADSSIGRPALQGFVGALSGKGDAGVFITTSRFTREAIDYADRTPMRLILIDGDRLASLMIRYEVGVQVTNTYHSVELDEDFFE
ncbi:restriction endonuclease [Tessaracoccus sp. Y36]